MDDIVIVGSGLAGHRAASEIHRLAPDRTVHVVGSEPGRPYDRPPLSKEYLLASEPVAPHLRPGEIYEANIVLRESLSAVEIDREGRSVRLSDGSILPYGKLLLATGSRLRRMPLPSVDPARVFYLRTLEDAGRLRAALTIHRRVVIVGGGFIGLEVAAAARQRDCEVTVLEMAPSLLSRGATPALADHVRAMHVRRGSHIVLNARVDEIVEDAAGITLQWNGGQVQADMIVIGIGILPNIELAAQCGLATADGIVVDHQCRTSDESIFAAGEVTNYPIGQLGLRARTESWSASTDQAIVAANNMLGGESSFVSLPWFWSDQYDVNIQCLGMPNLASRFLQLGDTASDNWLRIGVDEQGHLLGAEAVNMGREISALRRADRTGQPIPTRLIEQATLEEAARSSTHLSDETLVKGALS
jgi:NADPH-dependent 2,4-dienoyl-CoA reductase/sulfur reductase-like enzyme